MNSATSSRPDLAGNVLPLHSLTGQQTTNAQRSQSPANAASSADEEFRSRPYVATGYPGFTKWIASADDFFVLRRFNQLNAWVQLQWQDEIAQLEEELEKLNEECRQKKGKDAYSSSLRHDPVKRRQEILRELRPLLKDYNDFVLSYSELRARSTAKDDQIENYRAWHDNNQYAITDHEQKFIEKGTDVIPLVERKKPFMRILMEKMGADVLSFWFPAKQKEGRVVAPTTKYSSNKKIDVAMTFILVGIGLATLLGPMWWLSFVQDDTKRLGIISGFIILFSAILASATVQQPFEVMAGTAAYAAVLIVYLQQNSSMGGPNNIGSNSTGS